MEETGHISASAYLPSAPVESASNIPPYPTTYPQQPAIDPPAYPQQPAGNPADLPAYPQQPSYPPAYPQQPSYPPAYPQQPAYPPAYPQQPSYPPAYPQQANDNPAYPVQPTGNQPFTTVTVVAQPMSSARSDQPQPSTYLPFAVFNILCCCFLLGVFAKRYGALVIFEHGRGNYEEAQKASKKALSFNIAALVSGIAIWTIVIGVIVLYFAL